MADIKVENFWDDKKRTADALEEIAGIEKNATNIRYDDDKRIARAVEKIQKEGGIPSGGGAGGSQADWNENDSTSPAYILNKPFGIPTEEVILENGTVRVTWDDDYEEWDVSSISTDIAITVGEYYIFTIDGVDYITVATKDGTSGVRFENVRNGVVEYYSLNLIFHCFDDVHEAGTHTVKIRHISHTKIDANMYVSDRNYGTSESGKLLVINDQGIPSPKPITEYILSIIYSSGHVNKTYNEMFDAWLNGKPMTAFVTVSNLYCYLLPLAYVNSFNGTLSDNVEFIFQAATYAIDQNSITSTTVRQLIINSSGATYSEATS